MQLCYELKFSQALAAAQTVVAQYAHFSTACVTSKAASSQPFGEPI